MKSSQKEPDSLALPTLRADLRIRQGAPTPDGVPTWTIYDPVRNKYFQIGWASLQMLSHWSAGSADQLIEHLASHTTCQVAHKDVEELIKFLYANNLTCESPTGSSRDFVAQSQAGDRHCLIWLIHNYLFFRIPLCRPDRFLTATLPIVSLFFTKTVGGIVVLLGVLGLFLAGRQWEAFTHTFLHFFSIQGMVVYGVALCGIKIFHELGHAYTAARYGCRVPTMGVAFLVLFPVLYTDTTDAWRLTSRRERLMIAAAGMITELGIAIVATVLWSFLPEGMWRSVAFVVATTSWVVGLTINLNPFLRFDGYYMLSDWLGVPNLQDRSFALGQWKLRELLFAIDQPPPERVTPVLRFKMIAYAWSVWVFRFFLFLSIAFLVYHFFFKLLGIILFAVEILWFIVLPIAREIRTWWNIKSLITRTRRSWLTATGVILLGILAFFPWSTRVSIPAVLEAAEWATVFAPAPARIVAISVNEGQQVKEGDVLVVLEAPEIDKDIALTKKRIDVLRMQARRQPATAKELADRQVVAQEFEARIAELNGLLEQQENLVITAPMTGVVTDLDNSLHAGRWVNEELPLAYIVESGELALHGLAPETELTRLAVGQPARFFADDPMRSMVKAQIQEIRHVDEGSLNVPYLASTFGGGVAVRQDDEGKFEPESSVYRVKLEILENQFSWNQAVRGVIHVTGTPQSFAGWVKDRVAAVLIRESSF